MKTVSVIGSFRKDNHYSKVVEVINKLKENNIKVLSPAGTEVVDSVDNFVIFASDDKALSPSEIESATLEKILSSDIVYVCDVDGYIGRTTAYEIGCCDAKKKEIYFLEYPKDFIINSPIHILTPETLAKRNIK